MEGKGMNNLPNELLLQIFSYLQTEDLKHNIPKVCTRWGQLSVDPKLWANIEFETLSKTYGGTYSAWNSTLRFLQTTPHLQNIIISQGHSIYEVVKILDLVNDYCPNIRKIEFHIDLAPIVRGLKRCDVILKKLEFLNFKLFSTSSFVDVFRSLSEFKNLKGVSFIDFCPLHKDFEVFLENCPLLEHLNITGDGFCKTNFMSLLEKKERFVSLCLRIDILDKDCIAHLATFPRLKNLKLLDNNSSLEKLLEVGKVKSLRSLHLSEDAKSRVLTSCALSVFFHEGCFEKLYELKLQKSRLDDTGAREIRRNCPNLVSLEAMTYPRSRIKLTQTALLHFLHCKRLEYIEIIFDNDATDWIYRRSRYVHHECDVDGECSVGLDSILLSWDEVQIPID